MTITFGREPDPLRINLAYGAAFVQYLDADPEWPAGTVLELRFPRPGDDPVTWSATVQGDVAWWSEPSARVNEVLDAELREVQLWHQAGPDGLLLRWAQGPVVPS